MKQIKKKWFYMYMNLCFPISEYKVATIFFFFFDKQAKKFIKSVKAPLSIHEVYKKDIKTGKKSMMIYQS
jgi:hypothetical protein